LRKKKAKSEIENFKTLWKSEGILNWRLKIKLVPLASFVGAAQAPSVCDESDEEASKLPDSSRHLAHFRDNIIKRERARNDGVLNSRNLRALICI
jgi:hypothetical protein